MGTHGIACFLRDTRKSNLDGSSLMKLNVSKDSADLVYLGFCMVFFLIK